MSNTILPPPDTDRAPTLAGDVHEYDVPLRPEEVATFLRRLAEHFDALPVGRMSFEWDADTLKARVAIRMREGHAG